MQEVLEIHSTSTCIVQMDHEDIFHEKHALLHDTIEQCIFFKYEMSNVME
jgi:hypothetical protein